jgi:hypothetical protein
VSEVLNGHKAPSPDAAARIARVMGADDNTVTRARRHAEYWQQHRRETTQARLAGESGRVAQIRHQLVNPDVSITIGEGDLFDQDTHIAVGFSDTFDTSITGNQIINATSLQGQLLTREYHGDEALLDAELAAALAPVSVASVESRADKPHGKLPRYPLGTVAVLGPPDRLIFAVAYGRMGNDLIVRSSTDDMWYCYTRLWEAAYRHGQRGALSVPLMGAGLARVDTLGRSNLTQLILLSFLAYSRARIICHELRILMRPSDIQRIDTASLQVFLRTL